MRALSPLVLIILASVRPTPGLALDDAFSGHGREGGSWRGHAAAPAADPGEVFGFDFTPDDCAEAARANQMLGGALGGVVGGLIGSGIGGGSGKTAATIGGAVLGALGGAALGGKVSEGDPRCLPEGYEEPLGAARLLEPTERISAGLR